MASLRPRADTGALFFDFRWQGKRYRAQTDLGDSPESHRQLQPKLQQLKLALKQGTFAMQGFFPELCEPAVSVPDAVQPRASSSTTSASLATPNFTVFAERWLPSSVSPGAEPTRRPCAASSTNTSCRGLACSKSLA